MQESDKQSFIALLEAVTISSVIFSKFKQYKMRVPCCRQHSFYHRFNHYLMLRLHDENNTAAKSL